MDDSRDEPADRRSTMRTKRKLDLSAPVDDDPMQSDGVEADAYAGGVPELPPFSQTQQTAPPPSLPNSTLQAEPEDWGRLIPLEAPSLEQTLVFHHSQTKYTIGRNNISCDFVFDKAVRVSSIHVAFHLVDTKGSEPLVMIEDLKSSNGTFLNGERLTPNKRRVLKNGDDISLGQKASSTKAAAPTTGKGAKEGSLRFLFSNRANRKLDQCEIFDKYHIMDQIGSGTFAEVKRGLNLDTQELVAIKEIQKHKFMNNKKTMQLFEREIEILGALSHPAVCSFIECFEDDSVIYLVLEYVAGGNLLDHIMSITTDAGMPEAQAQDITRQICVGMAYCHRQGVTHRDLKPENVLLTDSIPPQVKIADFGLAKMIEDSGGTMLKSMVGTPQYLAPEVVLHEKGEGYGQAVDSWSVGIIVYAMLTKLLPFSEEKDDPIEVKLTKRAKERVDYTPFDDFGVSGMAKDFVDRLLTTDPKTRMSLEKALLHPWLRRPRVSAPSTLEENGLPTVTSLGKTEPMTTRTEMSSGGPGAEDDLTVAISTVPSSVLDEYSQPFAKLNIKATLQQGVRADPKTRGSVLSPIEDMSVQADRTQPPDPVSRFSSSSAAWDDTIMTDGNSTEQLGASTSVAAEIPSSAPDGRAPAVVHPPIAPRPAPSIPAAAAPTSVTGDRKRKHSPSPSATPAAIDVFGGSSSLSSIGAEQDHPQAQPRTTRQEMRSASTGPSATAVNGHDVPIHTPVRQSKRNAQRKDGPSSTTPASASLRRSTRRRTTSPSRFKTEDERGNHEDDDQSPVKRSTTNSSRATSSARSTRRKS